MTQNEILAAPLSQDTHSKHYQGQLSFSQLPQYLIEFGWQDQNQKQHVLSRTQQQNIPVYWTQPTQATHLWIKTTQTQDLKVTLNLKAHQPYPQHQICDNKRPESTILQNLQTQLNQLPTSQHRQLLNDF